MTRVYPLKSHPDCAVCAPRNAGQRTAASKAIRRAWLATPAGQAYLERTKACARKVRVSQ